MYLCGYYTYIYIYLLFFFLDFGIQPVNGNEVLDLIPLLLVVVLVSGKKIKKTLIITSNVCFFQILLKIDKNLNKKLQIEKEDGNRLKSLFMHLQKNSKQLHIKGNYK